MSRGIESICGTFSLTVSEKFENESPAQAWPINEGDECSVTVNGETLVTGFVDVFNPSYGADDHSITISGRDKAADFVDSSAYVQNYWEFTNANVYKLAKALAAPHNLSVSQLGIVVPGKAVLAPEAVDQRGRHVLRHARAARRMAGIPGDLDGGEGGLILTQPGMERATTSSSKVRTSCRRRSPDVSGRFAKYIVLAQHAATDDFFRHEAAHVLGSDDPNVSRANRVLIVRPEHTATTNYAQKRAQWEATVRAARSNTAQVTVRWTQADNTLWPVNAIVRVRSRDCASTARC